MKLDPTVMRYMTSQDFHVLEAVEKGMKNHALVPLPLITSIADLRHGGGHKIVAHLLRDKLLSHENKRQSQVDGYRITNAGYDILALHNLKQRSFVAALGPRIGTGKESDVYLGIDPKGHQIVLKFHRLGRTSFRNVRKKRDYTSRKNHAHSWLFLSRLSALKEFCFMKALSDVKFPTPTPLAQNRHLVCMSLIRGIPLYQIFPKQLSVEQAKNIYEQALQLTSRLASHGLVHCDLNEFNLMVDLSGIQGRVATASDEDPYVRHSGQSVVEEGDLGALSKPNFWDHVQHQRRHPLKNYENDSDSLANNQAFLPIDVLTNGEPKPIVILIDFPQMISVSHRNAREFYERDLDCLTRFFAHKMQFQIGDTSVDVRWEAVVGHENINVLQQLDLQLQASGYTREQNEELELYYFKSGPKPISNAIEEGDEDENLATEMKTLI